MQAGLLAGNEAHKPLPMGLVIARELQIIGSHGVAAVSYDAMWEWARQGKISPQKLITRTCRLEEIPEALAAMGRFDRSGVTIASLK